MKNTDDIIYYKRRFYLADAVNTIALIRYYMILDYSINSLRDICRSETQHTYIHIVLYDILSYHFMGHFLFMRVKMIQK